MPCNPGCLCNTCCKAARAFAYGHWNLQEYDDFEEVVSHNASWRPLEDGSARRDHLKSS